MDCRGKGNIQRWKNQSHVRRLTSIVSWQVSIFVQAWNNCMFNHALKLQERSAAGIVGKIQGGLEIITSML